MTNATSQWKLLLFLVLVVADLFLLRLDGTLGASPVELAGDDVGAGPCTWSGAPFLFPRSCPDSTMSTSEAAVGCMAGWLAALSTEKSYMYRTHFICDLYTCKFKVSPTCKHTLNDTTPI